ncbi:aspartokinase 3 [Brevibacillus reuszeri]|uniref:Aspartokinase n=1 Tax=Brevibacillus reuszeri TaxID=54915 RepID=A0A0K9YLV1_9BACL|nr:aspartate kinase [Brevibacillus reuszeri]KNB69632.1 aspartate kinase [Brevibacillus reuszeri]MED1855991.1 aspartate kinase [Brevibacillus reuszeri]GED71344.1 aspartokinase 3 [Brevibacillus reuszeri]
MKVAKFGGTSLANAEQIKKVCGIIQADRSRRLIVVSAPGKRYKDDTKVTDLLIAYAERFLEAGEAEAEKQAIYERYQEIVEELGLSEEVWKQVQSELEGVLVNKQGLSTERFIDAVKAAGEDTCAKVVAHYLSSLGEEAAYIQPKEAGMLVTDEASNAHVLPVAYEKLAALRERKGISVFPGFFGYSTAGDLVTFSRGGSDITGSILAAAVKADVYENFTDVDSVYVVNPNLIPEPKEVKEITYREMRELSYSGFGVFHEEALIPAYQADIPVCIKNTNNPSAPGTLIMAERPYATNRVSGIASDSGFCSIYVSKYLMNKEIGFGRKLLQILEEEGLSYEHTPSGIDNISVILRERDMTAEMEQRIVARIQTELEAEDIAIQHGLALVMIVGEGMRRSVGTTARATTALAVAKINLEMINQGSSEVSMMFGVKAEEADRAVIALYHEFFGEEESETQAIQAGSSMMA